MPDRPSFGDCPVCGARLALPGDLVKGELLQCDDCQTDLDVVELGPVELRAALKAEEYWDEYREHGRDD